MPNNYRYKVYLKRLENDICIEIDKAASAAKTKIIRTLEEQARKTKSEVRETIALELDDIEAGHGNLKKNLETSRKMAASLQRAVTTRDEVSIVKGGLSDEWESLSHINDMLANGILRDKLDIMVIPIDVVDDLSEINIQFCDIDISRGDFKLLDTQQQAVVEPVRRSNPFYTKPQRVVKANTPIPSKNQALPKQRAIPDKKKRNVTFSQEEPKLAKPTLDDEEANSADDDDNTTPARVHRDVTISDVTDDPINRFSGNVMLASVSAHDWMFKDRINLTRVCDKFTLIQRHFWCLSKATHSIMIANLQGQQTRYLEHENMRYPCSLTQYENRSVVVACHSGFGLLEFDFAGDFASVITNGSFSDVCYHKGAIAVLEVDPGRLLSYEYSDQSGSWACNDEISLDFMTGNENDSIVVGNSHYYISSVNSKCIFVYTLQGALLRTHRDFLPGGIGAWHQCHLAAVDDRSTMLIINKNKHHLLTVTARGATSYVKLESWPRMVDLFLDRRGCLWILDDKSQIHVYQQALPVYYVAPNTQD